MIEQPIGRTKCGRAGGAIRYIAKSNEIRWRKGVYM